MYYNICSSRSNRWNESVINIYPKQLFYGTKIQKITYIKDATAHNFTKVSSVLPSRISLKSTISFKITNSAT